VEKILAMKELNITTTKKRLPENYRKIVSAKKLHS